MRKQYDLRGYNVGITDGKEFWSMLFSDLK
jgi:hypothetical protein